MTKKKKPKVGDTVGWVVITGCGQAATIGGIVSWYPTRLKARARVDRENYSHERGYRIAKIVLSK